MAGFLAPLHFPRGVGSLSAQEAQRGSGQEASRSPGGRGLLRLPPTDCLRGQTDRRCEKAVEKQLPGPRNQPLSSCFLFQMTMASVAQVLDIAETVRPLPGQEAHLQKGPLGAHGLPQTPETLGGSDLGRAPPPGRTKVGGG